MSARRVQSTYQIVHGDPHQLADVDAFIRLLNRLDVHPAMEVRTLFEPTGEITVTRAPGRLDVMGGIADYSGSLMLELPIAEATFVALQRQDLRRLRVVSLLEDETRVASFEMPLSDFERNGRPIEYDEARTYFANNPKQHWAAYVAGVFLVLMRDCAVTFDTGASVLISSRVPEGKGVSSSAALEVATMTAVAAAYGLEIESRELALLCQRVENLVVGAPCGVMDQMSSVCGEQGKLLALVCQPAELLGTIPLPDDLSVWGLDSGVRHSVGGGDYGSVRVGTFMGYRIISDLAGLPATPAGERVTIDDARWRGYLANVTPSEFEASFSASLPEQIRGEEFTARYHGLTDPVTRIEPGRTYQVRAPAAHAVYENFRVHRFAELLSPQQTESAERRAELLGELMYQSHASYSACGLGSEGTDTLVQLVKEAGVSRGLYGAKITGGGSGGTVAVLGRSDAEAAVVATAERFAEQSGYYPYIFRGSSPGSASFGDLIVRRN